MSPERPLRVLFVAPYVPSLLRPRPFHLVRGLVARGFGVCVVALAASDAEAERAAELRVSGVEVRVVRASLSPLGVARHWLLGRLPLHVAYGLAPAMRRALGAVLARGPERFDVLHVEHVRAAPFGIDLPVAVKVFDAVDCHSRLLELAARHGPTAPDRFWARLDRERMRRFERRVLGTYGAVVVSSEADRRALDALVPDATEVDVRVVPTGVDLDSFRPAPAHEREPETLVFVGRLGYHANRAALQRLLDEIMPRVWKRRPKVRLRIVGEGPPAFARRAAHDRPGRVAVTGFVPDVRPYLARATLAVAPLPYAVGIQNKVLEALATATPVIVDPAACAALDVIDGAHLVVAEDDERFADEIVALLGDRMGRDRLGAAGRAYVETHHRWEDVVARLQALYEQRLGRGPGRER